MCCGSATASGSGSPEAQVLGRRAVCPAALGRQIGVQSSSCPPRNRLLDHPVGPLHQIAITVAEVERALPFYRDVLGLRFLFSAGPKLAFLSDGSVRFMLSTPQGARQAGANSPLYFRVDAIDAAYAAITGRGATPERLPQMAAQMPDHELWIAFVRDPEGNLIGLMEERRG